MPNTKRAKLAQWIEQHSPSSVTPEQFEQLKQDLHPISESYLRKLLRDTKVPLAAMVDGVRQANLEDLERTLLALLAEYEAGDAAQRMAVRKLVITAKDHAKWRRKDENLLWLRVWLENPPLFPAWAKLRRASGHP